MFTENSGNQFLKKQITENIDKVSDLCYLKRQRLNISVEEASKLSGVSERSIHRIENKMSNVSIKDAAKLFDFYNITELDFLTTGKILGRDTTYPYEKREEVENFTLSIILSTTLGFILGFVVSNYRQNK